MTDTPKPPLPVVLAPAVPAAPHGLDAQQLLKLAHELGTEMKDVSEVLQDYKLTQTQYEALMAHPGFAKAVDIARQEWNGANKTVERLRVKAAASLEIALPTLTARMMKNEEPLPAVVETGKLFAKMAGVGEQGGGGGPSEKFSITIDLGADKKLTFEKVIDVRPEVKAPEIQQLTEGEGADQPLQQLPKKV